MVYKVKSPQPAPPAPRVRRFPGIRRAGGPGAAAPLTRLPSASVLQDRRWAGGWTPGSGERTTTVLQQAFSALLRYGWDNPEAQRHPDTTLNERQSFEEAEPDLIQTSNLDNASETGCIGAIPPTRSAANAGFAS